MMVSIQAADGGSFQAYLALPATGSGPGLVLMQEIFGVNKVMRDTADWYAARGFVVACPDLFWRQEPGLKLSDKVEGDWEKALNLYQGVDESRAVDDSAATLDYIRQHPACTGRAGAFGFCLGGKLAYLLAARHQPDAAVGYYGVGIDKALDEAAQIKTPLMLHIAGEDPYCPAEARQKIHTALAGHRQVTLHDYAGRDHAFARQGGEHFHTADAELADLRTLEFLLHQLAGSLRGQAPSPARQHLSDLWDEHVKYEFHTRDPEATVKTMVADAYVNHVPTLTGGAGQDELLQFYSERFIPQMPPDTDMVAVSRTVGEDRVVDEMVFRFTHTIRMDWMLPGVPPTGKRVEIPLIAVVHFREGKLAHEHIYWDQASVLVQLGLLRPDDLPVAGIESARKVLDPKLPANALMRRADDNRRP